MKKRLICFLVLIFLSLISLFAMENKVGVMISDPENVLDFYSILSSTFVNDFKNDESSIEERLAGEKQASVNKIGKELHVAYQKEDYAVIAQKKEELEEASRAEGLPLESNANSFILLDGNQQVNDAFLTDKPDFLSDYCLTQGLDCLFYAVGQRIGDLIRYRVFYFEGTVRKIYEHIYQESGYDISEDEFVLALVPVFYPDGSSLIVFTQDIPDFVTTSFPNQRNVVRPGTYEYTTGEDGNGKATMEIAPGTLNYLDFQKPKEEVKNLLVTASSNKVSLFSDGKNLGYAPLLLQEVEIPFQLLASQEGKGSLSIQTTSRNMDSLFFDMNPQWMSQDGIYSDSRQAFYESFFRTILFFGANVLFKSFSEENTFFEASSFVMQGAIAVSFVDLFTKMFDYYANSKYISR